MTAKGYTTATLVAHELAQDLTAPQLDRCADLIEAAEHEVDRETGRTWMQTTPVSSELHSVYGPVVYLNHRPVASVTTVTMRPSSVGQTLVTLTAGTDYELIDATNGVLLLAGYAYPRDVVINTEYTHHDGFLLFVSYTHSLVLEPAIQKITTELVAHWMRSSGASAALSGVDLTGVKSIVVPDMLSVTYQDAANTSSSHDVPPDIQRRLRLFEKVLIA